ncbi:hypothetical protein J8273_1368 [Carpediemonas membranifera]|uniref:Uncharacterized protein n=1 Tax=Carpediemonas membranifera TaxID=201153 RepID=A0A8J6BGH7_9EUKA|nr:hypothetical protein J8273_1368 [Carpediemonas membranifera]|eukprot:KAG9397017.1 hypothetical protein J8273_1368 [Carpediemonas membranifera]
MSISVTEKEALECRKRIEALFSEIKGGNMREKIDKSNCKEKEKMVEAWKFVCDLVHTPDTVQGKLAQVREYAAWLKHMRKFKAV